MRAVVQGATSHLSLLDAEVANMRIALRFVVRRQG